MLIDKPSGALRNAATSSSSSKRCLIYSTLQYKSGNFRPINTADKNGAQILKRTAYTPVWQAGRQKARRSDMETFLE
jgi:hypothetical protein